MSQLTIPNGTGQFFYIDVCRALIIIPHVVWLKTQTNSQTHLNVSI